MKEVRDYKHILWLIIVVALGIGPAYANDGAVSPPKIQSASAILTDAVTGQILYAKNIHEKKPIASTTKIMTAILVLENCKLDETVTASKTASETPFTSLHLLPGERASVDDLLHALLIRSANDTAVALAEHIGGTVPGFVQMMNDKAKLLGAKDTHYVTPNGLYAADHYSSAYDLALITRYALRNPEFNRIIATKSVRIDRSINKQDVLVRTKSKFLLHYPGADGVKSGYIKQAGHCFVGSATRNGWRLVSVVLKSADSQADTVALMDYGFKNYQMLVLADKDQTVRKIRVKGGKDELEVVPAERLQVAVRPNETDQATAEIKLNEIHAPVRKGDTVGTMTAYVGSKPVASVDLKAAQDVNESIAFTTWPWVRTVSLLTMLTLGVVCGRTSAKSHGNGRSRLS
ncbi:MAG: D-alanyl-D-alanine carboxypeptidase family protein [Armatimonadota bacterium]